MREVRFVAAVGFLSSQPSLTRVTESYNPNTRRKQVVRRIMYAACRLGKYCCCGDKFARLVHRGVGGSPRVMVQHARVVVGATSYYHGTIHKSFYGCCCPACYVVWCVIDWRCMIS